MYKVSLEYVSPTLKATFLKQCQELKAKAKPCVAAGMRWSRTNGKMQPVVETAQ